MKSVGIITYHHYYNYGTMLQAYALQHKISELGYRAELIDFKQDNSLSKYEMLKLRLRRLPVYIKERQKYKVLAQCRRQFCEREVLFEDFYKKYVVTSKRQYTNTQQLVNDPPSYNGYVVGSDQTWNPHVANAPEAFFLPFVKDNQKKGSYGPSLAVNSLPGTKIKEYQRKLSKFSFLSCREQSGAELLRKIIAKDVTCVLDPTLLLSEDEWADLCQYTFSSEPYILVYFLGERPEHRSCVKMIQKLTGWKVVSLPMAYLEMEDNKCERVWGGPSEFLALIKGAALVCTDSFHGTMFSINFKKNFYSFCKSKDSEEGSENSRLYSALDLFGLSDRIVKEGNKPDISSVDIDYNYVMPLLEKEREKSVEYLKGMLREITKG